MGLCLIILKQVRKQISPEKCFLSSFVEIPSAVTEYELKMCRQIKSQSGQLSRRVGPKILTREGNDEYCVNIRQAVPGQRLTIYSNTLCILISSSSFFFRRNQC